MPPAKFIISINSQLIDKPSKTGSKAHFATIWEPHELSPADLQERVKRGHAFSAQFKSGYRKSTNFLRTNMLAADADGTITIEDALQIPLIRDQASFLYTTSSHTEDTHRFRVVFVIERLITNPHEWANALLGLARKLGTDPTINDGARLFYGNRNAEFFQVGGVLSEDALQELIALGEDAQHLHAHGKNSPIRAATSTVRISPTENVRLASGEAKEFGSLGKGESVHCPFHHDAHASAFTVRSSLGMIGLHCKACNMTYWPSSHEDDYDFNAFDRLLRIDNKLEPSANAAATLERYFPPKPRTEHYQQEHLPAIGYSPGIILVKSPKGTGKTKALEKLVADVLADKYPAKTPKAEKIRSILLVGHRQSLIREASKRLGLKCYLDNEPSSGKIETLAVCLDSLDRLTRKRANSRGGDKRAFDLVIIDESEQVLAHLVGETISKGNKLQPAYHALEFQIKNAKAVIALDADLSLVTTHALQAMRPDDWSRRCKVIYNKPAPPRIDRTVEILKHREPLERDLFDAIRRGEKCFVASNSKKDCEVIVEMLRKEFGGELRIFSITSDNSRDARSVHFLKNIKEEILKYDVLVCSPSLSTGIDISFPNDESKIPNVYGFFNRRVSTHTDIDQQLWRVRHPQRVKIWISPESPSYSANFDVILDELGRAQFVPMATLGQSPTGLVEYNRDHPLLLIAAHIFASRRASMNRLIELFVELREANGWKVSWNNTPPGKNSTRSIAEAAVKRRHAQAILAAPELSDIDYVELDQRRENGDALFEGERRSLERFEMQKLVGQTLTAEAIEDCLDSELTSKIKAFREIDSSDSSRDWKLESEGALVSLTDLPEGRLPAMKPDDMLRVVFRKAGVITAEGQWNSGMIECAQLRSFGQFVLKNRLIIEQVLRVRVRSDVTRNPVRFLNVLLSRIGLHLQLTRVAKIKRKRIRYYALEGVERMQELVQKMYAAGADIADAEAA